MEAAKHYEQDLQCSELELRAEVRQWLSEIPSVLNPADFPSRLNSSAEWSLSHVSFSELYDYVYGKHRLRLDVDLFASGANNKLEKFFSFSPDPRAEGRDSFSVEWSTFECAYAFPPFNLIQRTLRKIILDEANVVLITPLWPSSTWFSSLVDYDRVTIGQAQRLLRGPAGRRFPLHTRLVAWLCFRRSSPAPPT